MCGFVFELKLFPLSNDLCSHPPNIIGTFFAPSEDGNNRRLKRKVAAPLTQQRRLASLSLATESSEVSKRNTQAALAAAGAAFAFAADPGGPAEGLRTGRRRRGWAPTAGMGGAGSASGGEATAVGGRCRSSMSGEGAGPVGEGGGDWWTPPTTVRLEAAGNRRDRPGPE